LGATDVFSVNTRAGTLCFRVGFCERYLTLPDSFVPLEPFCKAEVHVPFGVIDCRAPWQPPVPMPRGKFGFARHPWQGWMAIDLEGVVAAVATCREVFVVLPGGGFRRDFR
jgi:hypothetical protein